MSFIVAIDGPAGTGKGTIAQLIAKDFDFLYVDTGAMFRCVTFAMLKQKINIQEQEKIEKLLDEIQIDLKEKHGEQLVLLNGEDVTKEIRTKEVVNFISEVSSLKIVRSKLLALQREIAKRTKCSYGRKRYRNNSISKCRCKNISRCISRRTSKKKSKTK